MFQPTYLNKTMHCIFDNNVKSNQIMVKKLQQLHEIAIVTDKFL